jgi:hypothetical protein
VPSFLWNDKQLTFVWDLSGGFSPEETFMAGQSRVTTRIRCAYNKRHEVIDALTGYSYVQRIGDKNILSRRIPLEYPWHGGLWCVGSPRNTGISPYGAIKNEDRITLIPFPIIPGFMLPVETLLDRKQPDFVDAQVVLQFSSLPYTPMVDGDVTYADNTDVAWRGVPDDGEAVRRGRKRYIHRTAAPAGKFITIPGNFLYFKETGFPVPQSSAVIFQPSMDIRYDWFGVPESHLPQSAWNIIPGSVNRDTFDGFPPQTLLCMQPTFRTETNPFGKHEATVTYTMRFLPNFDPPGTVLSGWEGRGGTLPGDPVGSLLTGVSRGWNWVHMIVGVEHLTTAPIPGPVDPIYLGKIILMEVSSLGSGGVIAGPIPPRYVAPLTNTTPPYRVTDFRPLFRLQQP